ncbi:glycosyltransferase family 76 protein [Exidia glandulosa HHB12029]|uniref:GPI mannosyltransferase 2 n=1 Tax=Exidia glandulosa HHB12029 TaxID=1314781 RepID=A0A165BF66_EXIGL|nr:glycosyltransferase family 76 protein [Exidia glandulosa HHB12029]
MDFKLDAKKLAGDPRVQVARWASVQRIFVVACVTLAAFVLPTFDASPAVASDLSTSRSLRWDAFYFASIARNDYAYEQHWAFLPGAPFIARILSRFLKVDLLLATSVAAFLANPILHLYDLTFEFTGSANISRLVAALSLLPSSPATLIYSTYAEPFFTTIAYTGMLACSQKRYEAAALTFMLTAVFRSNGIVLGGFILWDLLVEPVLLTRRLASLSGRRVFYASALALAPVVPFALYQYRAYRLFCSNPDVTPAAWCSNFPPSIYTHVQRKYWNNGLLRYWTLQQLPNFLIAAPVYALLFTGCYVHLRARLTGKRDAFFRSTRLTSHALHALFITLTILLGGHVQIMLRLAASMPFLYWSAAWLWLEHPKWARAWVGWSACWGAISVILWAAFLPPA